MWPVLYMGFTMIGVPYWGPHYQRTLLFGDYVKGSLIFVSHHNTVPFFGASAKICPLEGPFFLEEP